MRNPDTGKAPVHWRRRRLLVDSSRGLTINSHVKRDTRSSKGMSLTRTGGCVLFRTWLPRCAVLEIII